eukprot:4650570-Alexandrium_andersonii.AAC.1
MRSSTLHTAARKRLQCPDASQRCKQAHRPKAQVMLRRSKTARSTVFTNRRTGSNNQAVSRKLHD